MRKHFDGMKSLFWSIPWQGGGDLRQCFGEFTYLLKTTCGIAIKCLVDNGGESQRNIRAERAQRWYWLLYMLPDNLKRVLSRKWRFASQHLKENRSQRINI